MSGPKKKGEQLIWGEEILICQFGKVVKKNKLKLTEPKGGKMTVTYRLRATYLIYITLGIVSTFVLCLNNEKYLKKN